jgi:hypothetical protein
MPIRPTGGERTGIYSSSPKNLLSQSGEYNYPFFGRIEHVIGDWRALIV